MIVGRITTGWISTSHLVGGKGLGNNLLIFPADPHKEADS